jgi:glyoxylase-like metal-dependent hydrolase (beta-lactamase superfamily II)
MAPTPEGQMASEPLEQWNVGAIVVTKMIEMEGMSHVGGMVESALEGASLEEALAIPWLKPKWMDESDRIGGGVHSFLIETAGLRIVVDTGIGNDKPRVTPYFDHLQTDFLKRMELAGWPADSVSTVICTHLHVDHVGWNTTLTDTEWKPTFANAEHYFVDSEFEHWKHYADDPEAPLAYRTQWARDMVDGAAVFDDSVRPVAEAGLVRFVEPGVLIAPGIRLVPSPGHTPGHVSIEIESEGERAVITGDMMHSVLQIARPDWSSVLDTDPKQSRRTREELISRWADTSTLVLGTHFGTPTGGFIVRDGDSFRLV